MIWSSKAILSLVELIIYLCLAPVTIYTLFKHKLPSLLGHVFLFAFIVLRLVADGLAIHNRNSGSIDVTAAIINSVGVSPLLLATAGFVSESRHYILDTAHNEGAKKMGWIMDLIIHIVSVTGIALLAIGFANSATATSTTAISTYHDVAYIGAILLLVAWVMICVWAFVTFRISSKQKKCGKYSRIARLLLVEIMVSLPFTGARVCYSIVYAFDHSPSVSPVTASFVVDFFLIFLVQLVAASVMILGLFVTRNIHNTNDGELEDKSCSVGLAGKPGQV